MIIPIQPKILLIGGLAMRATELLPLSETLVKHNIQSFIFDNLCVGNGARPEYLDIKSQAEHQWRAITDEIGEDKISIFGISMGGMIAAQMATIHPERITHLFLTATSANTENFPAINDELFNQWIHTRSEEQFYKMVEIAFGKTCLQNAPWIKDQYARYRISKQNNQSKNDFVKQINSIKNFDGASIYSKLSKSNFSITVVAGDEDLLFNRHHLSEILKLCPNCHTEVLKNTGHMIHLENLYDLSEIIEKGLLLRNRVGQ